MTEAELISKLQGLKGIKPNQDWVLSAKMKLFDATLATPVSIKRATPFSPVTWFTRSNLAYALAMFLVVFIGGVGLLAYGLPQPNKDVRLANQTLTVDPVAQASLKESLKEFKDKSEVLAQILVQKNTASVAQSAAIKEVKDAARTLADNINKNPQLAKTIALDVNNSKSQLDIPGGSEGKELEEAINTPYKALVEQLIEDQKKVKLNNEQQAILDSVIELHKKGRDSDALVSLVLLVRNTDGTVEPTVEPTVKPTIEPAVEATVDPASK